MKKKDLPLNLVHSLKVVKDKIKLKVHESDLVKILEEETTALIIIDTDPESAFHFQLVSCALVKDIPVFSIRFSPRNGNSIETLAIDAIEADVDVFFTSWLNMIKTYEETTLTDEEAIEKSNQERFLQQFNILDDDADKTSFDLQQQLFLSNYLTEVINHLDSFKGEVTEEEIENLQKSANEIKRVLTKSTKKEIVNKLTKFWGKAQVVGLQVIQEVFVKYLSEITAKLLLGP